METFELNLGGHEWEKQNLVTLGKKKMYDVYKCRKCGIIGKSYRLGSITIKETDIKKIYKCNGRMKVASSRIKVTRCRAVGKQFSNLTPGSEHDIVPPPPGQDNKRGEWVMGVGEPVLLLAGEYVYCKNEKES